MAPVPLLVWCWHNKHPPLQSPKQKMLRPHRKMETEPIGLIQILQKCILPWSNHRSHLVGLVKVISKRNLALTYSIMYRSMITSRKWRRNAFLKLLNSSATITMWMNSHEGCNEIQHYLMGSESFMWFFLMVSFDNVLHPNTKGHLNTPLWKLSTNT